MTFKVSVVALGFVVALAADANGQVETGQIFGRVTDASGSVLPGFAATST